MAFYRYKAITTDGRTLEGEMEAASQLAVIEHLQALGHLPLVADEHRGKRAGGSWLALLSARRPSLKAITHLTSELATLLGAGLPLARAIEIVRDLTDDEAIARLLGRLLERIRGGSTFAAALQEEAELFPRIYIGMIHAGEASGTLDVVMKRLAGLLERSLALRETVQSALFYPTILLGVVIVSIVCLLTVVVPQFKPLFEEMGRAPPLMTRVIMALGDGLSAYGWIAVPVLAGGALLVRRQLDRPGFRQWWDRALMSLPLCGGLAARVETARFTRTLSVLLQNGVLLVAALDVVIATTGNMLVRNTLASVLDSVKQGQGLAEPMRRSGLFPSLAIQLIRVGEETGQLDEMLLKTADIYDGEVQRGVDRLMALLVPALTIGLGLVVAVIVGSLLTAILSVNQLAM